MDEIFRASRGLIVRLDSSKVLIVCPPTIVIVTFRLEIIPMATLAVEAITLARVAMDAIFVV